MKLLVLLAVVGFCLAMEPIRPFDGPAAVAENVYLTYR
jgi:hypothetical protein